MIRRVAIELELPSPRKKISYKTADALARIFELLFRVLPGMPEPPLTRYSVSLLANSTTLDISAARNDLGYKPRIAVEEGFVKFINWWKNTHPIQG